MVVVFEQPTEPLSTLERCIPIRLHLGGWEQDDIALALMWTFSTIVRNISDKA